LGALCGYGLSRWLLEPFRAPDVGVTVLGGLRLAQVVGLVVALIALWALGRLASRTE
jgi:prolipoprotein diacylglyceryltransferase